ncbi:MAG: 5'/3'-nucleotidase SurE [Pirellulales bacterium]
MNILLTNDDGIYAPGLAALRGELERLGDVHIVAPATEQSGVGHAITYLTPLIVKEVFHDDRVWGWAVEGSPADCVKIGVTELCPERPELVVSGINSGLNAGINVLYSGTVAAAIEGAFFGIDSFAVSLEFDEHAGFHRAARLARGVIEQVLRRKGPEPQLYNVNIPRVALGESPPTVSVVPTDVVRHADRFEKRYDPWGREYFWLTGGPLTPTGEQETDLTALQRGHVTLTPLDYNLTRTAVLEAMSQWGLELSAEEAATPAPAGSTSPTVRTQRKVQQTTM